MRDLCEKLDGLGPEGLGRGHAGTVALKAELTAVGDSPLAAAEAAGDGSKGLAERAGGLVAAARAAIEAAREATLPEECTAAELRALGRLKAVSRTIIAGFPCMDRAQIPLRMPIAAQIWAQMQPKFPCGSGSILPRAPAMIVRTGGGALAEHLLLSGMDDAAEVSGDASVHVAVR